MMCAWLVMWTWIASAAEGPPPDWVELQPAEAAPAPEAERAALPTVQDDHETVVLVVGEHVIAEARADVVRKLGILGWRGREARDGSFRFSGPEAWMGKARLYPSGDLVFSRVPLTISTPYFPNVQYDAFATIHGMPSGPQTTNVDVRSPSKAKVEAVQQEVQAAVQPEVAAYREALQRRALGALLSELPARLDRLWTDGVGLDNQPLATPAARRAALLDYWGSRSDTPEGRAVMRVVESFLRNEVQASEHPLTAEEIEAAQLRRSDDRKLDL
jgi:hypothetical protein